MHPDSDFPERHLAPESPDTWALAVRLHRRTSRRSTEPATPAERPACNPTCNAGEGTVAAAPSSVPPKPGLAPLRRVVGYVDHHPLSGRDVTVRHELLECGHHAPPKQDAFGETNAYRRRCRQCLVVGRVNGRAF